MNRYLYAEEKDNKRIGLWLSILFHILLIFFFLLPCFSHFKNRPPDDFQGVIVALGEPDMPEKTEADKSEAEAQPDNKAVKVKRTPEPKSTPVKKAEPVISQTRVEEAEVTASEKASAERARKALEEKERMQHEEAERKASAERQRIEEEKRRAEEKDKAKSKFSSMFSSGAENDSASKGRADGQPDASELDKLTSGSAKVGTGLGERELLHAPEIHDNTQKTGRVVVTICVDSSGKVMSSKYRQKGSTTTDAYLVALAERSAAGYRFSESSVKEQCGDIIIDFKLK